MNPSLKEKFKSEDLVGNMQANTKHRNTVTAIAFSLKLIFARAYQ